jgi:hypothetical protein
VGRSFFPNLRFFFQKNLFIPLTPYGGLEATLPFFPVLFFFEKKERIEAREGVGPVGDRGEEEVGSVGKGDRIAPLFFLKKKRNP